MTDFLFREYSVDDEVYSAALQLRNRLLRLPLGLDLMDEDLTEDASQRHFGMCHGDQIVASVSIKPLTGGLVKLRQMCVEIDAQRTGLGRKLIEQVEPILAADGIAEIELAARVTAVPFYERLGYRSVGSSFFEVEIPHQKMVKRLLNSK